MTVVTPSACARVAKLTLPVADEAGTYAVLFTGSGDAQGARLPAEMFSSGAHAAQSDGGDVCFTASDGTSQLNMEIVGSIGSSTCEIWVSVTLSASVTTDIYVFYESNSGTLAQPAADESYGSQAVWSAVGDEFVSHDGGVTDSTGATTPTNNGTTQTTGQIGSAAAIIYGAYISVPALATVFGGATHATLSAWISRANTGDFVAVGFPHAPTYTPYRYDLLWYSDGNLYLQIEDGAGAYPNVALAGTGAHHVSEIFDGTLSGLNRVTGIVDGNPVSLNTSGEDPPSALASAVNLDRFAIGIDSDPTDTRYSSGWVDEVRLSLVARSADYIATDYAIQSTLTGLTVGTPEDNGGAPPAVPEGYATLGATGALAAAGARESASYGTLTAMGGLAAIGKQVAKSIGTLAASGTLTATGRTVTSGAAALAAAGAVASVGYRVSEGLGILTALGTLAIGGYCTSKGIGSLVGDGTLALRGYRISRGVADLTGIAALAAAGRSSSASFRPALAVCRRRHN